MFHTPKAVKSILNQKNCAKQINRLYSSRLKNYKDLDFKVNDKIHGYTVKKVFEVEDLRFLGVELEHDKTKAKHIHAARTDSNNVFGVTFTTPPTDSGGLTHVLEHMVLCGSKNYECHDPFFNMMSRSMASYMNAFTASRYTTYPFATQNEKDYKNLMSVYLDAVFFPNLTELDFLQEGWRLEHEVTDDSNSPLNLTGVVYNEMKGALSSSDTLFYYEKNKALFGQTEDGFVSGGNPPDIVKELTWEKLVNYHKRRYHPSNSRFYTYGDMDLNEHLQLINEKVLSKFEMQTIENDFTSQYWTSKSSMTGEFAAESLSGVPLEKQTKLALHWPLSRGSSIYDNFSRRIFSDLLVNGTDTPLYLELIKTGLADSFIWTGYSGTANVPVFSIGLKGIKEENVEKVKPAIYKVLRSVLKNGFAKESIEGVLHQEALFRKSQNANFGINLGNALMGYYIKDYSLPEVLDFQSHSERLKKEFENGSLAKRIIEGEIFANDQRSFLYFMKGNETFSEKLRVGEENLLVQKIQNLTLEGKAEIFDKGQRLAKYQQNKAPADCLPSLALKDIDRVAAKVDFKETLVKTKQNNEITLGIFDQPTNGLTYVRFFFDLKKIPSHLKPYLSFFTDFMSCAGAGNRNNEEMEKYSKLWTGGITLHTSSLLNGSDINQYSSGLLLTSNCIPENLENMFSLLKDLINKPHLDDGKNMEVVANYIGSQLNDHTVDHGDYLAIIRANAHISDFHAQQEMLSGISQVGFMINVMNNISKKEKKMEMINALQEIANILFTQKNVKALIHTDLMNTSPSLYSKSIKLIENFLNSLPETSNIAVSPVINEKPLPNFSNKNGYFVIPANTNFNAMSIPALPINDPRTPALSVLLSHWNEHLHSEIREKGGAYGSDVRSVNGVVRFSTYRDPNTERSFDIFNKVIELAKEKKEYTDTELLQAKLKLFQDLDSPTSPGQRWVSRYIHSDSYELVQKRRDLLFDVGSADLHAVANDILTENKLNTSCKISLCSDESTKSNYFKNWENPVSLF